ncbi:MAG: response regulator [Anaerolineae bacterium]|nr:response regulator [Anaerolineae bacterium]
MSYIIIAEDERDILLLMQRKLEMEGYAPVWSTDSGTKALEKALAEPPRLMIIDVILPDISGLEVCAQVKKALGAEAPPIIISSAKGQPLDLDRGTQAGADRYLVKPFAPRELIHHVRDLIG